MPPDPVGDSSRDPKPIAATLQVALVLLALALVIAIAGVPGLQPSAGNGSMSLKRGWAEKQVARADEAGSIEAGSIEAGSIEAGSIEAGSIEAGSIDSRDG